MKFKRKMIVISLILAIIIAAASHTICAADALTAPITTEEPVFMWSSCHYDITPDGELVYVETVTQQVGSQPVLLAWSSETVLNLSEETIYAYYQCARRLLGDGFLRKYFKELPEAYDDFCLKTGLVIFE